ncbi:MAG: polysaccharide deacetylase family protein [Pseudomonadales bacterium]
MQKILVLRWSVLLISLYYQAIHSIVLAAANERKSAPQLIPNHAVILLYHHVSDNTPAITSISPQVFEQQLLYLENNGFSIWPLTKIIYYLQKRKILPDKTLAITFDDSYQSVFSEAYPRLKIRHWPFTIFVSTDSVDQGFNYQTSWDELRSMAANGATIANHSTSHKHLLQRNNNESKQQWRQRIRQDIETAQRRIQQGIGSNHKLFAYPYGEYNGELTKLVESLGYIGFGQQSGAVGENNVRLNPATLNPDKRNAAMGKKGV